MIWRTALVSIVLTACVGGDSSLGTTHDNLDNTDPKCAAMPAADRRQAAIDLYDTEQSNPFQCFDDTKCPCGTYCSNDGVCLVDCVANPPPGELACGAGRACTSSGRCGAAPNDPPPPLALSIAFGEAAIAANTTTGAVPLAIHVTTTATSLDALDDAEAATVHFSIREVREQQLGIIANPPPVSPVIKCTSAGSFTTDCDLAGGWSYNVVAGTFHSQPRTIWVQVPRTATPLHWTLEARSANASGTTTEVINATPVVTPATDPGHYKGTLSYANSDTASPAISIPIEAIVTASAIVVLEPTKLVFADGQVVVPRTTQKATQLGWLTASGARYDVALSYMDAHYDPTRGHLDSTLDVSDGTGAASTILTLSLDRTGNVDAPACPCATGSYCNARLGACLPGTAPTDQASVDPTTYHPSSTLASAGVTAWTAPLLTAAGGSGVFATTGHTLLQQAYCYNSAFSSGALDANKTSPTSADLECAFAGNFFSPQRSFSFEETSSDYVPGTGGGAAQDLLDNCIADLASTPTGSTIGSLIPTKSCASLGRFYLALAAGRGTGGVGVPMADIDQRLVMQILRQWLGVNAYVAHTDVQDRDYDDALSLNGAPAYQRFGTMLDQVDADLRVLLDPEIKPQFTTGAALTTVLAQPDYRVRPRPVVHWSFNSTALPSPDSEGTNPLAITGTTVTSSRLAAQAPGAKCQSTNPIATGDHRYSVVFALDYKPAPGSIATVFYKVAPNGDRLSIDATPGVTSDWMNLRMYDSHGGSVTFSNVASGLIAIVVEGTSYTLYSSPMGSSGSVSTLVGTPVNGGPNWGAAGTVNLNCNLPSYPNSCTSWDLNTPHDGGDYTTLPPYVSSSATYRYSCKETASSDTCTGTAISDQTCTTAAADLRTTVISQLQSTPVNPVSAPPQAALNALTTRGTVVIVDEHSQTTTKWVESWTDWRCDTTITGYIAPATRNKPVCGGMKTTWDEVSIWDRPIQAYEFANMAARYVYTTADTVPPVVAFHGSEQPTALPVHMLEAAAADLELLAAYAKAEQTQAYADCSIGAHSTALDRIAQRGGPNLRLVGVLEGEADHLVAKAGTTAATWYPRYAAAKQQLAARRAIAVQALLETSKCENPLGISKQIIPLYVGEEVGANAKFFASSRYLAGEAQSEITRATTKLVDARLSYTNQRQQAYQLAETAATKQVRIDQLRANAESQLERYCGSSPTSLYDALVLGTVTNNNCFIDRTLPQCGGFETATFESLPQECLRGELGNQVLVIKTAGLTLSTADDAMHDAMARYDGALEHCAQEQRAYDQDDTILHDHDTEMARLHDEQAQNDLVLGLVKAGLDTANPFSKRGPAGFAGVMDTLGALAAYNDASFASMEQAEQSSYSEEVQHRSHIEALATCYYEADNLKYQIDAARDQLLTAKQQLENANHQLSVDTDQLTAIVGVTAGQIATEDTLTATPAHLHYWLDENISEYHRHLEAARRLTYLAVRALEYEAQASLNLRGVALGASVPDALQAVVDQINATNAPLGGQLGVSVNDQTIVLSLRDEILKLSQSTGHVPGDPVLTPVDQFQRYLRANSSVYLDANGKPIGRGIRFAVRPDTWNTTMCDERIWRIQPSLQIDNPPNQHTLVLYQVNTFGSQDCHAAPGAVLVSHADPAGDLLVDNTFALPQLAPPQPYVASNFDGPTGLDRTVLAAQPQSSLAAFAGRGLYSNYVLLFPEPLWTEADIKNVKDVLIRFDISDVTHAPNL